MESSGKIVWLFTTFPVNSETFLQREVRACRELGLSFEIYSLWGGGDEFEGIPIHRFSKWKLCALLWEIPLLVAMRPRAFVQAMGPFFRQFPPSLLNKCENLVGLSFAILYAGHFKRKQPLLFHAVWATMPAAAARVLAILTGIPYSVGAHAYDVFEHGGDWILKEKLRDAQFIHTSTEATGEALLKLGAKPEKIRMIRRGLLPMPPLKDLRTPRDKLRIVSVGRLVEKKGWLQQLEIYAVLRKSDVNFEARLIGSGRLKRKLHNHKKRLGLSEKVRFFGQLTEEETLNELQHADVFIFTGIVADSGDRDGLPNVIPEAMACGLCVLTTAVGGVLEAIEDGKTGLVLNLNYPEKWVDALRTIQQDNVLCENLRKEARKWVEQNFDATRNSQQLIEAFESVGSPMCGSRGR